MIIDSSWKDFYDRMQSQGVDTDCIYRRITQNIGKDKDIDSKIMPYSSGKLPNNGSGVEFTPILIGFAGKIYPIIRFIKYYEDKQSKIVHLFNMEQCKEFVNFNGINLSKSRFSFFYRSDLGSEAGVKNFFNQNYINLEILFVKHNVPVFQIELEKNSPVLILNPKLKDVDFVHLKDPYTTYQEIFMFKAGVLGNPEKEIVTISDKDKAKQLGHDGKYSFKTVPKGKK